MKRRMTLLMILTMVIVGVSSLIVRGSAEAISTSTFRADRIADDAIFFNGSRMSTSDVQAFLNAKVPTCDTNGVKPPPAEGSAYPTRAAWGNANPNDSIPSPPYTCLRHYSQTFSTMPADAYCSAVAGGTRSAADMIVAIGQACGINPQVIIVLLQKEMSFITDDWPWPVQYARATGYDCPDSGPNNSANCNPEFANFFSQLYYGTRQFKKYIMQPNSFNYAVGRTSFIGYNPNEGCGGTNITPNTQATAALYNYTPYQPNAATLAAPEGVEVNCGAYGNLNFWRKFNDWFGPTLTNEFAVIMADNGDPRQWVLENGVRYVIPDTATKIAWGLSPKWDQPYVFNGSYISTLPSGPTLGRVVRPAGGLSVYFVDGGKKFRFSSSAGLNAWGYNAGSVIDVPSGLSNQASTQGDITYTVSLSGDPRVFLMDGGTLRHVTDPNVLAAWVGDSPRNTPVSNTYFNSRPTGGSITTPKITDGVSNYFVDNSRKLKVDNLTSQLFPVWTTHSVSTATLNRLGNGPNATYVVKSRGSPSVYIADQGLKHHVTDPNVLAAWQSSTFPSSLTEMTNGFMNTIGVGTQITDYILRGDSKTYVMERGKRQVPTNLTNAYATGRTVYNGSTQLISVFPSISGVTGIVKPAGQPQVYVLTDTGKLRHLTSTNLFWLWARNQVVTQLTTHNIGRYEKLGGIGAFVSDGSTNYLIEGGQKHTVDATTKAEWGLGSPEVLDSGTISRISNGIPTPRKIQNNGAFYLIHNGKSYGTTDTNIAAVWGVSDAPAMDTALLAQYLSSNMLTRVASSSIAGDSRLFVVDRGVLYRLYPNHASNIGIKGNFTPVNPNSFTVNDWSSAVVKDEAGVNYVIDNSTKRLIPAGIIRDQWTYGRFSSIPTMTNGFLNGFSNGKQVERAIKGSSPSIYSAENFTKRWVRSSQSYNQLFAPYTEVSDYLLNVLPDGLDIP